MDTQKPVTAEEIAKMKKNGKTSLIVSAVVLVIVIILAMSGNFPAWLIFISVACAVLGLNEFRKAKKAEAAMGASTMTPPTPPSEPAA